MATLEDIAIAIQSLPDAVAKAVVVLLPPVSVDTTAIEAAINNGFATLTTEIKTNVEGSAPAPVADSAPVA